MTSPPTTRRGEAPLPRRPLGLRLLSRHRLPLALGGLSLLVTMHLHLLGPQAVLLFPVQEVSQEVQQELQEEVITFKPAQQEDDNQRLGTKEEAEEEADSEALVLEAAADSPGEIDGVGPSVLWSSTASLWSTMVEAFRLGSSLHTAEGAINIKPLVNLTINTFGLLDGADDGPADTTNSKLMLKSIFQMWNPEVLEFTVTL